LRRLALTLVVIGSTLLAGGSASSASGQIVVRRLTAEAPASRAATPTRAAKRTASATTAAPRTRAVVPPPLAPSGANAGMAAWRRELDVRAQRWRAIPDLVGSPRHDWSANARRRVGWVPPAHAQRNPHTREASVSAASGGADVRRIAFIRVDYAHDRGGSLSTGDGHFDLSGPDTTVAVIDRPPHNRAFYQAHGEALRRFYDAMSYGRVDIQVDVWPRTPNGAYTLNDMADFGPWAFSQDIYHKAVDYFRAAFTAADSQARSTYNDPIPWDQYDNFMIIHAGSDFQSDLKQDSPEDMPTFTIGVAPEDEVALPGMTKRISRTSIVPETATQDGFYGAINGLVAHENGHNLFGFADLYNVFTGAPVIGYWSLMDSGNLAGAPFLLPDGTESFAVGLLPPSVDPFHRFFTSDLLTFNDVVDDTMTIADSERNPDMRRLWLSSDEYVILENRAIAASDSVPLDQDTTTHVILGPKFPDRYEYDALLPALPHDVGTPPLASGGILAWHIDASTIPFETATRIDPFADYGFNSGPGPPAITVIEADGLGDLGDLTSPFFFGSPYDPWFRSNNRVLADDTEPSLLPHTGSRPHARLEFLDDPGPSMRVIGKREWLRAGWPVAADMPPGGPMLLAVDADGDRDLDVCWAGGADGSPDSTGLFAVRPNGSGLFGPSPVFANLDRRPRPEMAAIPIGDQISDPPIGPSWFAVSTYYDASADSAGGTPGGKVWLIDHTGSPLPGWPAALPTPVSTPPVITGLYPNAYVWVGGMDGRVYVLDLAGQIKASSPVTLPGGVAGRLAVASPAGGGFLAAAGGQFGEVSIQRWSGPGGGLVDQAVIPITTSHAFVPDFLWVDFGAHGPGAGAGSCPAGSPTLIVHDADRLLAFCPSGTPLPGWGHASGDTIVTGLGAGDADGDGFPEVLTQTVHSQVAFWNESGSPSPGWPRQATKEPLRTSSPALAMDVDGDKTSEIVTLDGSGLIVALRGDTRATAGFPLATGAGAIGAPVIADLDRDGRLDVVAPDRWVPDEIRDPGGINGRFGSLYAYSLDPHIPDVVANAWPMLGGNVGRTSALDGAHTPVAAAASAGPLVQGSLKAYPNPARRRPVSFAYQLTERADVDFSIRDASGHEVAAFTRSGRQADNVEVWDPGAVPAGLYVARLRFRGATTSSVQMLTLGVLR
jgi:M6 family metalloprotease-like protein